MATRRSLRHLLPHIIARDGGLWVCHYCGCALVPSNAPKDSPLYYELRTWFSLNELRNVTSYEIREEFSQAVVDHKHPLSTGGSNDISNLVAACRTCNQAKLSTPYAEFMKSLKS